ncbi:trans-aconitate methyltransferase 1 [Recurvomyces mirabilis]|nr:trans-aconitate methyltransferase 1 [Recurvomyces mirabilis]
MATFAKSTFSAVSYAAFRPNYPPKLYDTVLGYHGEPKRLCLDLGCGPGTVTCEIAKHFDRAIGTDPSSNMIKQAQSSISGQKQHANIDFQQGSAESTPKLEEGSVDLVVAGQAAHWLDYPRLWPEMRRLVRPGGTLAFWGYSDPVFVDFPRASKIMQTYQYDDRPGKLGSYWSMPGRSYTQNKLRVIKPPNADWEDLERIEYEVGTNGRRSGRGMLFMERRLTVGEMKGYLRTWSNYHVWSQENSSMSARSAGGNGDVVDEMFDEAADADEVFRKEDNVIDTEWGSGLVMARRNSF